MGKMEEKKRNELAKLRARETRNALKKLARDCSGSLKHAFVEMLLPVNTRKLRDELPAKKDAYEKELAVLAEEFEAKKNKLTKRHGVSGGYRRAGSDELKVEKAEKSVSSEAHALECEAEPFLAAWLIEQAMNGSDPLAGSRDDVLARFAEAWIAGWRPSLALE